MLTETESIHCYITYVARFFNHFRTAVGNLFTGKDIFFLLIADALSMVHRRETGARKCECYWLGAQGRSVTGTVDALLE